MRSNKKKSLKKSTAKILLAGVLSFGVIECPTFAFAQTPPPQAPPTPPPPGELLNSINPFKKNKKAVAKKDKVATPTAETPQGPPPPPNPLDLFKKKKVTPPAPPGS